MDFYLVWNEVVQITKRSFCRYLALQVNDGILNILKKNIIIFITNMLIINKPSNIGAVVMLHIHLAWNPTFWGS